MIKHIFLPLGLTLSTVLLLGAGCNNKQPSATTTSNTSAEVTDDTVNIDDIYAESDEIEVVTADVYGKDLEQVVRYPDSLRSYYSSNEYEADVTYQTTDDVEAIRAFYEEKLIADGWTNSEQATDYMEYTRGDELNPDIITLYLTTYTTQGLVEYELVYEPALTDEQMQAISEETSDTVEL